MKYIWILTISLLFLSSATLASESDEIVIFDIERMTCATCPIAVRKAMLRVDGVEKVEVDLASASAVVTFDPDKTTPAEIGQASTDVGFPSKARGSE